MMVGTSNLEGLEGLEGAMRRKDVSSLTIVFTFREKKVLTIVSIRRDLDDETCKQST